MKKLNKTTIFSNFFIVAMLVSIFTLTVRFDAQYVVSGQNMDALYNGNRNSNQVSLMVNVYWGNEYIQPMLDVFEQYEVTTTFFVGGSWAEKNQELLHAISSAGHEIGNHGYFHKDQDKLNYDQNYTEIYATDALVSKL